MACPSYAKLKWNLHLGFDESLVLTILKRLLACDRMERIWKRRLGQQVCAAELLRAQSNVDRWRGAMAS